MCLNFGNTSININIYFTSGARPQLYLAEGSKDILKSRNLQPATTKNTHQYRVVNCLVASAASGNTIHTAILVTDDHFTHRNSYPISDDLSIWLLPCGYDKSWLFNEFLKRHVIPRLKDIRETLVTRQDIKAVNFSPPSQEEVFEEDEVKGDLPNWFDLRAVLSFDGESSQMKSGIK